MALSGPITVDTTAGGVTIISTTTQTRLLVLENQGSVDAKLKGDASATALTTSNGFTLKAGERLVISLELGPNHQYTFKGIVASGSTTVVAQTIPA